VKAKVLITDYKLENRYVEMKNRTLKQLASVVRFKIYVIYSSKLIESKVDSILVRFSDKMLSKYVKYVLKRAYDHITPSS
jgi:hypothetical protein